MAADRAYLDGPVAARPAAFARQELDVFVHAALFSVNYLAFAVDSTLEISPPQPRREGVSAEDAEGGCVPRWRCMRRGCWPATGVT